MRRPVVAALATTLSLAVLVVAPNVGAGASVRPRTAPEAAQPMKGIAISLTWADRMSDANAITKASALMSMISTQLNANAVSLNFPLWQHGSASNDPERGVMTPTPQRMVAITEVAERYGLSVQWRPYLFEGNLEYQTHNSIDPTNPSLWMQNYWNFLRPYLIAANQAGVPSFSIAVELRSMMQYLSAWTSLVRRAKTVYSGAVVYSQQHAPEVSIPLTARGFDAYEPIPLKSPKQVSAAAFTRGFVRNLTAPGMQSTPKDMTLEEVGITATARAYLEPAQSYFRSGTPIDRKVQTDWFQGACNAFWELHLAGIYFYSISLLRWRPNENDSTSYGGWLGTPTQAVIAACFARTAGPRSSAAFPRANVATHEDAHVLGPRTSPPAPSVDWDPVAPVEPQGGFPESIACPAKRFCVEVDLRGAVRTEVDGSWSAPTTIDAAPLVSVSCGSASSCVAVDDRGNAFSFDGSGWTEDAAVDTVAFTAVSCVAATTTCVAVDIAGDALIDDAGSWSASSPVSLTPLTAVSCAATSSCVAVGDTGSAYEYDGTWTLSRSLTVDALTAVACPTTTFCVAGDDQGRLYRDVAGTWRIGYTASLPGGVTDIACASAQSCVALGGNEVVPLTSGVPSAGRVSIFPNDVATAIACAPGGPCTAMSYGGSAADDAAGWSATATVDPPPGELTAVSCGSATFCMTVDDLGDASTWDGSSWSPLAPTGLSSASAVSCVGTFCVAVSNTGQAVSYANGAWAKPELADRMGALTAVACVSTTFCAATDASNLVVTFDGTGWTAPATGGVTVTTQRGYTAISCASAAFCVAVSTHGDALVFGDGSAWLEQADTPFEPLTSVSCPTVTWCVAVDEQGRAVTYTGSGSDPGSWSAPQVIDDARLTSVSCTAAGACLAADDDGGTVAYADGTWGAVSQAVPLGGTISAVACSGTGTCAATDAAGAAVATVQ